MTRIPRHRLVVPAAVAGLLALAAALPAAAQEGPIARMLSGSNSVVTRDQVASALHEQFARLDTNHDGQISEAEFVDARLKQFDQADTDGNGVLSAHEIRSFAIQRLQSGDLLGGAKTGTAKP